ncbi:MAG: serine hydrolase [Clostridia bacterium]|nr:serine hydrolase [Clostridia bacterium]
MKYATPESCGIRTEDIIDYIEQLCDDGLSTHSVLIARGDNIIFEKYWAPFDEDHKHRLYSVTKSFAALAVGFLADEGRISLDAEISEYFPEECAKITDEDIKAQTVRDMLMMRTAFPKNSRNWFTAAPSDRVEEYFTANSGATYPSHTLFRYDSSGSFVLGALCERVSGMPILEYLNKKLFSKLGITDVDVLKCPGGHSWMDSGLLMRPRDLMKCARFVLNMGEWRGEQLLSREYLTEATSSLVPTTAWGDTNFESYGYGYQIWRTKHDSFFFNGMGCQFAICNPDRDLILVYNGDNQGIATAKNTVINGFFNTVYKRAKDEPLPEYQGEPIGEYSLFALPKTTTPEVSLVSLLFAVAIMGCPVSGTNPAISPKTHSPS